MPDHPLSTARTAEPSVADLIAARPHLSMHAMDGLLLEDVPLNAVADALGTPTWVIGAGTVRARLAAMQAAFAGMDASVRYAMKANDHLAVLRVVATGGAGADVVSLGEFLRARAAGIAAGDIVFSGVGKTSEEMRRALAEGVGQINVESAEELTMLAALAVALGRTARVTLRVNPDVDAGTLEKISTGRARDKFGVPFADVPALYAHAASLPGIDPVGLSVHIGSQIMSAAPFRAAYARLAALVGAIREAGHAVSTVDCGGGLGIGYADEPAGDPRAWAGAVRAELGHLGLHLVIEPGRWLVGPAGVLLASVVLVKRTAAARFVVLDAAMNDLARPALYGAWHGILPVSAIDATRPVSCADVVGPVCESTDVFARDRLLPPLSSDARVAILDAGAYGAVMSGTYNARPLAAQAMVDGARWSAIRPRAAVERLWADETVPAWLA